jgi:hypothetical protein
MTKLKNIKSRYGWAETTKMEIEKASMKRKNALDQAKGCTDPILSRLFRLLTQSTDTVFNSYGQFVLDKEDKKRRRIFIDRNAEILVVAHADTVRLPGLKAWDGDIIHATGLDDRAGVAVAAYLSKKHNLDLLITDLEESGGTTGQFQTLKSYNFIVEFDFGGTGCTTYDIDNKEFLGQLHQHKLPVQMGTYSDIASLDCRCCAVNVGVGYYHAHSEDSYMKISEMRSQIEAFEAFLVNNRDVLYLSDNIDRYSRFSDWSMGYRTRRAYGFDGASGRCEFCDYADGRSIHGRIICPDCLETAIEASGLGDMAGPRYADWDIVSDDEPDIRDMQSLILDDEEDREYAEKGFLSFH